jgi:hypothetical protein
MPEERFELSYRVDEKDYMALGRAMERSGADRLTDILYWIGIGGLGIVFGLAAQRWVWVKLLGLADTDTSQGTFVLLAMVALSLLVVAVVFPRNWKSALSGFERFSNLQVVADKVAFEVSQGSLVTRGPWSVFSRVHISPQYIFLFMTRRQAFIIPRSVFARRDDEVTLLAWVRDAAPQAAFTGHGPT